MNFVINFFSRQHQQAAGLAEAALVGQIQAALEVQVRANHQIPPIQAHHRTRALARMKNHQKSKLSQPQLVTN